MQSRYVSVFSTLPPTGAIESVVFPYVDAKGCFPPVGRKSDCPDRTDVRFVEYLKTGSSVEISFEEISEFCPTHSLTLGSHDSRHDTTLRRGASGDPWFDQRENVFVKRIHRIKSRDCCTHNGAIWVCMNARHPSRTTCTRDVKKRMETSNYRTRSTRAFSSAFIPNTTLYA